MLTELLQGADSGGFLIIQGKYASKITLKFCLYSIKKTSVTHENKWQIG